MTRFNLTFSGEIIAGHDPAKVKLRFANFFAIDDPVRLERFFGGETIILRRNLERKAAAQCYRELHQMGALATLVKITDNEVDAAATPGTQTSPANTTGNPRRRAAASEPDRPARSAGSEQTWAVSTAASKGRHNGKSSRTSAASRTSSTSSARQRERVDIAAGIKARKLETLRQAAQMQASEQAAKAERERLAAEAAARKQAEALERERLAAEEAARLQAERERIAAAEAARQQAIAAEAARQAAEETARLAEEQARIRAREAEEEARRKAAEEQARRKAAEEAERREAERKRQKEEQAQRKAQAAAARKAEQEEKRRRDAEEKARRKAALEEKKRQAAAEAARRKAEIEEQKRLAAAEAARRKAELEEQKRQAAAEAARRKAELEAQQRLEAEAAARRKAAQEEQKRREAEEEARRIAAREAQRRQEEEEAARQKAELEELKRREAEEESRLQAELAAIKLREAEEARRLQAELEEQARQATAQAARIKAEAQRQQREAQQKSAERRRAIAEALAARQARQAEKRRQAEEPPARPDAQQPQVARAPVQDLPPPSPARRARPRIRTALEVPPRKSPQDAKAPTPEPRKRQPGEPNVYKLRPFRNTEDVRTRAVLARRRARHSYTLGILALAALLILAGSFLQRTVAPAVPGARAIAVDPRSGPLLLAQDALLFHDRAGIGTGVKPLRALGLAALHPPLAFDDSGTLMAMGTLRDDAGDSAGKGRQLLRCQAPLEQCAPFSPQLADNTIDAFVINPVDGSVLLADRSVGLLLKSDRDGAIVARADAVFAQQLVMRLHTGLLLMNSATAPAISVLRYENNAFGQQLDEILLLPPGVEDLDKLRVGDFLWSAGAWWVSLHHPESGNAGLYRFDEEWNFIDEVSLPATAGMLQLVNWGDKVLANDPQQLAIQRISALGAVEAPFVSAQLEKVSAEQARHAWLVNLAWRGALLLCALGALLGIGLGYLQSRRALVYQARREQGAEPLDEHVPALQWIDPSPNRLALLRRRMTGYSIVALGVLLLAVAGNVSVWQLAALLLALSGPAIALLLQSRRPIGHIGVLGDRLVLVDHSGTYHLAGGSRIQQRGPFLSIDDVVVYCGGRLLPAFSAPQIQQLVNPLARGGVKVDRDTIAVKLLQSRHPIALGVLAIAAALAAALTVLYLQEMA